MNRFDRALGILLLLRGGKRLSATALAARFEVSTRTIYRDVDALGALGAPVIAEAGRHGGFRLQEGYFLPPVMFSLGEAISLLLGVMMLSGVRARPFATELGTGEEKLIAAMPPGLRSVVAEARSVIGFEGVAVDAFHTEPGWMGTMTYQPDEEGRIVEEFMLAVLNRRSVVLRYRSPYRPESEPFVASPLGLFWDRDRWYLVGQRSGEAEGPRLWRADRVAEIRTQTRPAVVDTEFDVRRLLGRAWLGAAMADWIDEALVRIRMSPAQADRLRQDWFYGKALFVGSEANRVEMRFGQDDPGPVLELLRWLGPGAELIEPVAWRALMVDELVRMVAAHQGGAPSG